MGARPSAAPKPLATSFADWRRAAAPFALRIAVLLGLLAASVLLQADGGNLLFRKPAGPFIISVFAEPVPVRVGTPDFSVMLERASDQSSVLDATVDLHLKKTDSGTIFEVSAPATHARATNKLLYAASPTIPSAGNWQLIVDIHTKAEEASIAGELAVKNAEPAAVTHWQLFAVVPLMILFFVLNQWLRVRRRARVQRRPR